jgi:hypothetical protein
MLTDAPTGPGYSGAPVVNDRGALVGVVAAQVRDGNMMSVCVDVREVFGMLDAYLKQGGAKPVLAAGSSDGTKHAPPEEAGWVSLFNEKDLSGWKVQPENSKSWEVTRGILVGANGPGYLFSERGDYANYHLRMEAAINKGADSNVCIRTGVELASPTARHPNGYAVDLMEGPNVHTGPISFLNPQNNFWTTQGSATVVKPDQWFTLEIIADGNHLVSKVNGVMAVDFREEVNAFKKGHIALKVWGKDTVVNFRKIEIKEPPGN